jgi:FkbM family methyltransferase
MRLPAPGYRALFLGMTVVATLAAAVIVLDARRARAAKADYDRLQEAFHRAQYYPAYRGNDYWFTVESLGFVYRGKTGNVIDEWAIRAGAWEKFLLYFLEDYVAAAGVKDTAFIDVGANTGTHSLFMATRVKEVHAFDPYPPVLKRLHENIALNKFANVRVHEIGLGDRDAQLPFFAPDEGNHGTGSFRAGQEQAPSGHLRIVVGDEYLKGVPTAPVGVIKVDIEGFEEAALVGLRGTIERHRPLVVVEVTVPPQGTIASFEQLKSLFPANYEFFATVDHDYHYLTGNYELVEFAPIAEDFFKTGEARNLVVVPAEKAAVLPRRRAAK